MQRERDARTYSCTRERHYGDLASPNRARGTSVRNSSPGNYASAAGYPLTTRPILLKSTSDVELWAFATTAHQNGLEVGVGGLVGGGR